ncbi:M20/M25/M40 family metallo-hydrolase [Microbacterium azadirachtae]|uniref:M20/M25/M40 family metallo-hydrolase n=1 Tax=Microbacterium azadirachtae TaxID=582680 RepID=UPI00088B54BA|nr:M20/M25/M40 family metallo-hydrolase [Microbacterium azadirachtae]UXW86459.1 M20/M25/M40 family metallo-hydrolase [Microbacterium azadirachtae]SDL90145.1 Acetylornithine deacetylase/Succinyl-diaminopimelate desuccinylase [Microbacterium azadirachtae]SEG17430.1 Acetylornithine deacetylase/Succinyl-diaminopimelate desuccinylase [Microbacterium azadirachtae]SEG19961.1 Acetylornithine deacetylase/Succinyl-diaminopimelate desuccinylase [Microbacterium azadirachtae]
MTTPSPVEAEALELIRDLIRIESVNTGDDATIGDGETRAALFVKRKLEEVGYRVDLVEPRPGRASVVARLAGADPQAGALVVHAHLDVVPVVEADWTHPPFGAEIHDGILYGRGAVDMKNYAGTILALARSYRREGVVPRRDLIFAFFADEEAGGVWGARWIVRHRPDLFSGATEAISEVGGFSIPLTDDRRAYLVATAEKGVTWATLTARGHAAHGSRPTPDNAVVRLSRAVAAVGAHRFPVVATPALTRFLQVFGEHRGIRFTDEGLDGQLAGLGFVSSIVSSSARNTVSPTVLSAGGKTNVIPAEATARLDIRALPGADASLQEELAALVGDDVDLSWGRPVPAIESPIDTPLLEVLQDAITTEDPDGLVVPYLLPASTDNKHLAPLGIHGYGFVPLRVPADFDVFGEFHAADERIPVDALHFSTRVTDHILRNA